MRVILAALAVATRVAHADTCIEVSPIVGYAQCRNFAEWETATSWSAEVGMTLESVVVPRLGVDGPLVVGSGLAIRVGMTFGHFHLGNELTLAYVSTFGAPMTVSDAPTSLSTSGGMFRDVGFAGAHVELGALQLAADLGIGGRSVDVRTNGVDTGDVAWLLQARVGASAWIYPHVTFGIAGALDLRESGDRGAMIVLGFHTLAFDGLR